MRVLIDSESCQGHGRCYDLAPEVFGEDEDGYATLLCPDGVPQELQDDARLAVANCPEDALSVVEEA
jgi:ferredoxin